MEEKKNLLKNIKNKYILRRLFEFLTNKKFLNIIKYNKEIQNRLNVHINDYQFYLKIILEIIPKKKRIWNIY